MMFKISPFSKYKVHGNSMLPALRPDQQVLTLNWFYTPEVGDLVVLKLGDKQSFSANKQSFSANKQSFSANRDIIKRVHKVLNQRVYVLGDNQKMSTDSKSFGWVDKSAIIGKVILRLHSG